MAHEIETITKTATNGRPKQNGWSGVAPSVPSPNYSSMKAPTFDQVGDVAKSVGVATGDPITALLTSGLDFGLDQLSASINAKRNEKYAIRAEERADARNRKMLLDQPFITAEGRRRAGLNPYGDAVIPGMQSQSTIDTSSSYSGNVGETLEKFGRLSFDELVAAKRLEIEDKLADSEVELNLANAQRARGVEGRDVESFDYNLQLLIGKVNNVELKNKLLEYDNELRAYTIENEKALSDVELSYAQNRIVDQIVNIMNTQASIDEKRASIEYLNHQSAFLAMQNEVYKKTGLNLAYAEVEKAWATIANMNQDTALKSAQTDVERAAINEIYARIRHIDAETKEIPINARYARFNSTTNTIVNGITSLSSEVLKWFGAVATGGVSAGVSSIVSAPVQPGSTLFDEYGNVRKNNSIFVR